MRIISVLVVREVVLVVAGVAILEFRYLRVIALKGITTTPVCLSVKV